MNSNSHDESLNHQHSHPHSKVPLWFGIAAGLGLLWNLMGGYAFYEQMANFDEVVKTMSEEKQAWAKSIPSWINVVFAIAVGFGIFGSIALLMRSKWCVPLLFVSLGAVLIQMIYTLVIANGLSVMSGPDLVLPILVIIFAVLMMMLAGVARSKGWLR